MPRAGNPLPHRWGKVVTALAVTVAAGCLAAQVPAAFGAPRAASAAVPAAVADAARVETPLTSTSPVSGVLVSQVSLHLPLPASASAHPAACDWVSYLRFRDRNGPGNAADADRILVAQPGILEGASAFDSVARNTITQAAKAGKHVEFWALDRRSNCLEDHTGVQAALAAKDIGVAIDYYYHHKSIGGKSFPGYVEGDGLAFLQNVGLEQTLRDEYDLLRHELPDPATRKKKVLCGGHSLGGTITGYFAGWDFDGDPATTDDLGFNQCAGYFALDTFISTKVVSPEQQPLPDEAEAGIQLGAPAVDIGLATGAIPRTLALPAVINPETMNLLALAGVAADVGPSAASTLANQVPSSLNVDLTYRLLGSKDVGNFVSGSPGLRDFHLTNQAALGFLLDDNSMPLAFLQTSVGFFDGGPVADKNFPVGNDLSALPADVRGLFTAATGTDYKAVPTSTSASYTWRNYDQMAGLTAKSKDGKPFTDATKEVSDVQEVARSLAEYPLDFTEAYFPTRLVSDIELGTQVDTVKRHYLRTDGVSQNPVLTILAGDGLTKGMTGLDPLHPVILPGYQHLDVLTAATPQNGGGAEQGAAHLATFAADPQ